MSEPSKRGYTFGECSLDVSERRLLRSGVPVPLAPRVFDTLVLLVENAGHLVEKDEFMHKLWPGTFVGEDALARNISILRKALGDSSDSMARIVTVPTRGYRFEGNVTETNGLHQGMTGGSSAATDAPATIAEPAATEVQSPVKPASADTAPAQDVSRTRVTSIPRSWRGLTTFGLAALAVGALAGIVTFWFLSPAPAPKVIGTERITHSGRVDPWGRIVTDGVRIYFLEREGDHWNTMQTSVSGGESQPFPAPFKNTLVLDASPDHSSLLIARFEYRQGRMPLWIWPVQGGTLTRVGNITAYGAVWTPDGRRIVYSEDDGVYEAGLDGANAHKLAATAVHPNAFHWSPDGRVLRFSAGPIWEIDAAGGEPRRVLPATDNTAVEFSGSWSSEGKYFFFDRVADRTRDIWAIRETANSFRHRAPAPVSLTTGNSYYEAPVFSKGGSRLFVIATNGGGELVRYDPKSQQAAALLPGLCVMFVALSRDGGSIACPSPTGPILRMKIDGSERLTLVDASISASRPTWSPDEKQVAYHALTPNGKTAVFLAPSEGGPPSQLFPENRYQDSPAWSPDGKYIAFHGCDPPWVPESCSISILNLATNHLASLPGSQSMGAPSWSPDGRFIAAPTEDRHTLMLFDVRTQHWTQVADGKVLNESFAWSRDGKWLYFQDLLANDESVFRLQISSRKTELVASFETLFRAGAQRVAFVTLAPDGSIIASVDRNRADIYALDLYLP